MDVSMCHAQGVAIGDTREDPFIKLFLSGYEKGAWADAKCEKADAVERTKPAVDQIARRKSDGKTLAIEHTIIEPFLQEKEDFAAFQEADFLAIEADQSLPVPGLWIQVFVPVGAARKKPAAVRRAIVRSVHNWIRANRLGLAEGESQHKCSVGGIPGEPDLEMTLNIKTTRLDRGTSAASGVIHVRRQQLQSNLNQVITRALKKKVPKLVN